MAYGWGSTNNAASTASGATLTLSVTYAAHDRALIWVTSNDGGLASTHSISDGTNTYTQIQLIGDGVNNQMAGIFECKDCAAGTFTITYTISGAGGSFRGVAYLIGTGLDNTAANVHAGTNNNAPGSGANAVISGGMVPAAASGGMWGICFDDNGGESFTAGTGFTSRGTLGNVDTAFGTGSRIEDKSVASTASQSATFTAASGAGRMITFGYTVQDAGGGGGAATPTNRRSLLGVGT